MTAPLSSLSTLSDDVGQPYFQIALLAQDTANSVPLAQQVCVWWKADTATPGGTATALWT